MKAYLISDNIDTLVGMRLAGIDGVVVHSREEMRREIQNAAHNNEVGIILITEKLAMEDKEKIGGLKLEMDVPLIVEIPDRHGTLREKDRITRYIREAIGVKI